LYQLLETVNRDKVFPGSCRVLLSDFDYELPPGLIAQEPIPAREQACLLRFDCHSGAPTHHRVEHLPALLKPGDLLVINNTRVFPARLFWHRTPSGGSVECLLLARLDERRWDTLMHPGQKLKEGARVVFEEEGYRLYLEVLERRFYGRRTVSLTTDEKMDVDTVMNAIGHVPLPPYIKRSDQPRDRERYQTTYDRVRGSVRRSNRRVALDLLVTLRALRLWDRVRGDHPARWLWNLPADSNRGDPKSIELVQSGSTFHQTRQRASRRQSAAATDESWPGVA